MSADLQIFLVLIRVYPRESAAHFRNVLLIPGILIILYSCLHQTSTPSYLSPSGEVLFFRLPKFTAASVAHGITAHSASSSATTSNKPGGAGSSTSATTSKASTRRSFSIASFGNIRVTKRRSMIG